jgi:Flp pilus assembly protein TadB
MTYSELRASDAERERVVTFLREHALLGRLSDDELEDRIGLAYASITVGDLERLIADLPRGGRTAAPRRPAPRPQHRAVAHRKGPSPALIGVGAGALLLTGLPIALLVGVVAIAVTLVALVFALSVVFGPLLLIALLIIATARRRRPQRQQHMRWGPTC